MTARPARRWCRCPPEPSRGTNLSGRHTLSRLKVIAATATLVLAAIAGGFWLYLERGQVIQTERGEVREVALADGSVVRVDPESLLRVNYGPQLRRVYLERGRALFHVAKDPQRPFFVRADDTTVRAVGTEFGVEQGRDKVVITVAEGKVAVFPLDQNAEQPRLMIRSPRAVPPSSAAEPARARSRRRRRQRRTWLRPRLMRSS